MKVSFCIPAYKRKYLREAIQSLLDQTYKNIEIIVVDDKSPERLSEVMAEFTDSRIRYYVNGENLGGKNPLYNYNKAFSYATGDIQLSPPTMTYIIHSSLKKWLHWQRLIQM